METRQGKIEEKALKFASNKKPYATFTIDGKNYNSFDKEIIDNHNPDDYVEFTGDVNSKGFWELKTMKKMEENEVMTLGPGVGKTPTINGAKEYHLSPEEVKCRALECAIVVLQSPNTDPKKNLLILAQEFVEWIRDGN